MARDPEPFAPCIIKWEDAYTDATAQYDSPQHALDGHKPAIRSSIGFWIGRTPSLVAFATDDDRGPDSKQGIGGISYLPAAMVRSVEILLRAMPPKKKARR